MVFLKKYQACFKSEYKQTLSVNKSKPKKKKKFYTIGNEVPDPVTQVGDRKHSTIHRAKFKKKCKSNHLFSSVRSLGIGMYEGL